MSHWNRAFTSKFLFLLLATLAAVGVASACRSPQSGTPAPAAVSPDTWASVDGRPITRDAVDKAYRRTRDVSQTLSEEETLTAKLSLLNDMIVQDILIARAGSLKVEVPQSDLDAAYENAKKNLSNEAFQQELTKRSLTPDDMKEGLRREMLTQKVIEQEVGSKVVVSDKEITDFFNANRSQFNVAEESYHIAQIVITPVRDAQIANGTRDDASTPEAAVAKVKMLMERLKAGASFRDLAMGYSEDPESAPRGGDMGFLPISRLKQAPPALRDAVLNKQPGSVNVATAGGAYTLVLVVAHEPAGQRDLTTPGMKERITETLRGRREQMLRLAYLTAARADAKVENHLARRMVEAKGVVQ
jgi:peptidyl-prolyl cis-trans isomerase SurA